MTNSLDMVLIDTSVLLEDPGVIGRVIKNNGLPFITNTILSELDFQKKSTNQLTKENAKAIFRVFSGSNAVDVTKMPNSKPLMAGDSLRQLDFRGGLVFVLARKNPNSRNANDNDFKIIEAAKDYGMIIITRDKGLKVRADIEGVEVYVHSPSHQDSASQVNGADKTVVTKPFSTPLKPLTEKDTQLIVSVLPSNGDYVTTRENGKIKLLKPLSSGGEGTIYETDKSGLVCKVYHKDRISLLRQKKIELMLTRKINQFGICWPLDLVTNSNSEFVGYIMPRASGRPIQSTMFVKPVLEKTFPKWGRIDLVNLCIAFLDQIAYLHKMNIIVGDINPLNLLVDADSTRLWIVDTDSFQIQDFPCPVGTVNFTAPEIQGKNYSDFLRTKDHELFAITTMLFMILHPGKPPYAQQGGGNPADNIRAMDFSYPHGSNSNGKAPEGPWQNIWGNLTAKLREAFFKTFKNNQRLEISEWRKLLTTYQWAIKEGHNSNELFPSTFKIFDPVEVICGKCSDKVIASKSRVAKMASESKPYYCGNCMKSIRLAMLAKKSKDANQKVFQGNNNSDWKRGNNNAPYKNPRTSSRSAYSSTQRNAGGGFLSWVFSIFK